jgi:hypothetical protein
MPQLASTMTRELLVAAEDLSMDANRFPVCYLSLPSYLYVCM